MTARPAAPQRLHWRPSAALQVAHRPRSDRRLAATLLAAISALTLLLGLAGPASAATTANPETAVAAQTQPATAFVGAEIPAGPMFVGVQGSAGYDSVLGCCVAPRPTLSGSTVLGGNWDDAIRAGRRAKPLDGFYDVVSHGTPTGIVDDVGSLLSASDAATVIRGTPSWGGQNIRLLSCSTGCPTGNFAQGLADELGVTVRAPTVDFYVNSRGVPVLDSGGQWLTYLPGGG